jgi:hypothetical protein
MQDHEELQIVRIKEEMQQATQQLLFKERARFNSQLAAERATLEKELFEERQAKQLLEEESLLLKTAYEKEKEEAYALRLQFDRETELRAQNMEQEKREERVREEKEKSEKARRGIEEKRDIDYASSQLTKIRAYLDAKMAVILAYLKNHPTRQGGELIDTAKKRIFIIGGHCTVCWSVLPINEPFLSMSISLLT